MTTKHVPLQRKLTLQLLKLAIENPDHEICGLIGAKQGLAATCYPISNIAKQPEYQFEMDPQQQIEAMKKIREKGESLFATYHSHPTAPATPSAEDLARIEGLNIISLIISLNTKGVLEIRGFSNENQTVEEINLFLSES